MIIVALMTVGNLRLPDWSSRYTLELQLSHGTKANWSYLTHFIYTNDLIILLLLRPRKLTAVVFNMVPRDTIIENSLFQAANQWGFKSGTVINLKSNLLVSKSIDLSGNFVLLTLLMNISILLGRFCLLTKLWKRLNTSVFSLIRRTEKTQALCCSDTSQSQMFVQNSTSFAHQFSILSILS